MKKLILVVLIIFTTTHLKAQNFSYGMGFGPSFTVISDFGFNKPSTPKGVGFQIYGMGNYKLNKKLSIDSKLGFDNRKITYSAALLESEFKASISYITLNPSLKIDLGSRENKGVYLKAGARLSFLISAKERVLRNDAKDLFKSTNFGVNSGFGFDFNDYFGAELIFDYAITAEIKEK